MPDDTTQPALKIAPPGAASVAQAAPGEPLDDLEELERQYAEMGSPEAPTVSDEQVRALLRAVTGGVAFWLSDERLAPDLGRMTDDELDELVPPLTRIVNARPALRAAVVRGDEAAVLLVLSRYGMRTVGGARALAAARDHLATVTPLNHQQEAASDHE